MSVRGEFRLALQQHLQQWFDLPFRAGRLDGPSEVDVGCVWWEGKRPHGRDGNVEENFYRVRLLHRFRQDQGAADPRETVADLLETSAERLEEALKPVLAQLQHDFFNVVEVTVDYQQQSVEAQLVAFDRNRSSAGG